MHSLEIIYIELFIFLNIWSLLFLYLFLCSYPLLVSLPPGRVVNVPERFVPCCYSFWPEQLCEN